MARGSVGTVESMLPAYREYRPPVGLEPVVACLWEQEPADDRVQRIVPDGCVDVIWLAEHSLVMAGADTGPRSVELPAGVRTSGIRLRPGAAGAVLGFPASELRDRQVDASLVWGNETVRLRDAMAEATPPRRLGLLADAIARHNAEPDALVAAATQRLAIAGARVAGVVSELGISERQLHRRTLAAVGYGPKMLARVARLRRLIVLGCEDGLAQRALAAGYASQTHMNEEVRRLTGATPVRFLKDAALTAA